MRHLDEGTIHAWLDGELTAEESAAAESHTAGCASCAAAVAEARGLMAASSRIVGYLDDAPVGGGVVPVSARANVRGAEAGVGFVRLTRGWRDWPLRAAAAVLLIAGGTAVVVQQSAVERSIVEVPTESESVRPGQEAESASDAAVASGETRELSRAAGLSEKAAAGGTPSDGRRIADVGEVELRASPARADVVDGDAIRAPGAAPAFTQAPTPLATPQVESGTIAGVVFNESTGEPLSAVVTVDGTQALAVADSAGRFLVENVPAGRRTLNVRLIGYKPAALAMDIRADTSASVQVELALDASTLSGVVVTGAMSETRGRATLAVETRRCYALTVSDRAARSATAAAHDREMELVSGRLLDGIRGFELVPPAADATERLRHVVRLVPSGIEGRWRATDNGEIIVRWEIPDGDMALTLAPDGERLRGTIVRLDRREERQNVIAIEQRCENRE